MRISDWSSDVCSSDLPRAHHGWPGSCPREGSQGWPQFRPLQGPGAARSGCYGPTRHVRFRPLQGTRDRARHSLPLLRSQRGTPGLRSARACCQNAMMMTGAPVNLTQADAADVADLYNRCSDYFLLHDGAAPAQDDAPERFSEVDRKGVGRGKVVSVSIT